MEELNRERDEFTQVMAKMAKKVEEDKRTASLNEPTDTEFEEVLQIMGQGVTDCLASEMRELAMFDT